MLWVLPVVEYHCSFRISVVVPHGEVVLGSVQQSISCCSSFSTCVELYYQRCSFKSSAVGYYQFCIGLDRCRTLFNSYVVSGAILAYHLCSSGITLVVFSSCIVAVAYMTSV